MLRGFAALRTGYGCALGRRRKPLHSLLAVWVWACALLAPQAMVAHAAIAAESEISFPAPDAGEPILFGADEASRWTKGAYDIWVLRGRCYVQQGPAAAESQEAVLWVRRDAKEGRDETFVIAYLEGDVRIADARSGGTYQIRDRSWLGEFTSTAEPQIRTPAPGGQPNILPQVFVNAQARRNALLDPLVRPAQFGVPSFGSANPAAPPIVELPSTTAAGPVPIAGQTGLPGQFATPVAPGASVAQPYSVMQPGTTATPGGAQANIGVQPFSSGVAPSQTGPTAPAGRRLRAFSRSSVKVQVKWIPNPSNPQEWVGVISPGVNLIIDGLPGFGQLDISTDRMVVWTSGADEPDLSGARAQSPDRPLELYLEGNIVFREGNRTIYAERMYYNVNNRVGTILKAEVLSPPTAVQGFARLKADVVRQLGESSFVADNALLTTSRMTNPRYRVQSSQLYFQDNQRPLLNPLTGAPAVDPLTGETLVQHDRLAVAAGNSVFVGPVPVFYWPRLATDLEDPRFFIRNVKIRSDKIFGQAIRTDWDLFQLLNIKNKPKGHDWIASLDYLSERGPAGGTTYTYGGNNFMGLGQGRYFGLLDVYGVHDTGRDILGSDRYNLDPEHEFRHRIFGRHRQQLPDNFQLTAEVGWTSDRNFTEQYFEQELDTFKDQSTGIELKKIVDNTSWAISADARLNQYYAQTNQLPRFDHFWLGESLLGDSLTWYEHSSAEYAQLRTASFPRNPQEQAKFRFLPWEVTSSGERLVTAQEIDMPLTLGPAKVTPYVMGQAGHWGEVIGGNDMQRLYGQGGVRAALPFWSVNPDIQSELLNVNGLAHKVVFDVDASFAQANRDLSLFPLYDNIDDDTQEQFRRRFAFNTFGGIVPPQFDERSYALRTGLGGNVTTPAAEVVDDLSVVRMGVRQRLQTKRGPANKPRIIDWMTLDTEMVYFPRADRDNFGENFGLARYDYRWHIGDRLTLLSDGGFDFFNQGQNTISVGATLTRPTNGSLYIGYRSLNGPDVAGALTPFRGQVLITSASYRLSPKWFGNAAMSYDFSGTGTIGNNFSLVRIGESFLVGFNFAYDAYKDNVSGMLVVEPRFLPGMSRNVLSASMIPPLGMYGVE